MKSYLSPDVSVVEKGKEVSRYTGYSGETTRFWQWLGFHLLIPATENRLQAGHRVSRYRLQSRRKAPGTFVDPISGVALFRSDTKFESGTG